MTKFHLLVKKQLDHQKQKNNGLIFFDFLQSGQQSLWKIFSFFRGIYRSFKNQFPLWVSCPKKFLPIFFSVMQGAHFIGYGHLILGGRISEGLNIVSRLMNRTVGVEPFRPGRSGNGKIGCRRIKGPVAKAKLITEFLLEKIANSTRVIQKIILK